MTIRTFDKAKAIMDEIKELSRFNNATDRILRIEFKKGEYYQCLNLTHEMAIYIEETIRKRLEYLNSELEKL